MIATKCPDHAKRFTIKQTKSSNTAYCAECGRYYGRVRDDQLGKLQQANKIVSRKSQAK